MSFSVPNVPQQYKYEFYTSLVPDMSTWKHQNISITTIQTINKPLSTNNHIVWQATTCDTPYGTILATFVY